MLRRFAWFGIASAFGVAFDAQCENDVVWNVSAKWAVQTGYPGACTNCFINLIGADNYVNEIVHCTQETKFIIDPNHIYIFYHIRVVSWKRWCNTQNLIQCYARQEFTFIDGALYFLPYIISVYIDVLGPVAGDASFAWLRTAPVPDTIFDAIFDAS